MRNRKTKKEQKKQTPINKQIKLASNFKQVIQSNLLYHLMRANATITNKF